MSDEGYSTQAEIDRHRSEAFNFLREAFAHLRDAAEELVKAGRAQQSVLDDLQARVSELEDMAWPTRRH